MPTIITSSARGPQGPQGPPGSSDSTALLGVPLDPSVGAPPNYGIIGYDAWLGKWTAYTNVDVGTF